jgi:hypothetical protein
MRAMFQLIRKIGGSSRRPGTRINTAFACVSHASGWLDRIELPTQTRVCGPMALS